MPQVRTLSVFVFCVFLAGIQHADEVAEGQSGHAATVTSRDEERSTPDRDQESPPPTEPESSSRKFSPEAQALRAEIQRCLAHYLLDHTEDGAVRSPWGVMHSIVGFGVDTPLQVGAEKVNAIGWLCWNRPCNGLQLFSSDRGEMTLQMGPGYQGHGGQFLMIMAYSRVPKDYGLKIDGRDFTIADVVKHEQLTCQAGTELCFKLLALVHYLGPDATWRNQAGESWSIERLIQEELKQPVIGTACGGTHRMCGFGYAVRKRELRSQPVTGHWARAQKFVGDYVDYTYRLQNVDGSFSSNWFEGRGDWGGVDRKINTTGHTLEWLLMSLPDDRLTDPRLVRAVRFLTNLLWDNRNRKWEIGPQGHALHALALYDERVFGSRPGNRATELAELAASMNGT